MKKKIQPTQMSFRQKITEENRNVIILEEMN